MKHPLTATALPILAPVTRRLKRLLPGPPTHYRSPLRSAMVFLSLCCLTAVLERRSDALTAWNDWLGVYFGLLLPSLALPLSWHVTRSLEAPYGLDRARARLGYSRRRLLLKRLLAVTCFGVLLGQLTLLGGRAFCYSAMARYLDHDVLVCMGLGVLATVTYITFFAAVLQLGLGRLGSGVALGLDLTLGHSSRPWAYGLPHPYVLALVDSPVNSMVSPVAASGALLALTTASTLLILLRTPR